MKRTKNRILKVLIYTLLILIAITMLVPFLWMISTSIKSDAEVMNYPPTWLPKNFTLSSYVKVWKAIPFGRFFLNSSFVAIVVTACQLFLDSLCAYGFARRKFPGKNVLFVIVLATMMIPRQVTMIPLFIMLKQMPGGSWIDTYKGLIIPGLTGAYGVFLMRQYIYSIPVELEEAAMIDGYSTFKIFIRIMLPLCKTALISLGIFVFLGNWNDFTWPLIIISTVKKRTLPIGIAFFQGQYIIKWNLIMAASAVATIPIAIIYFLFQKEFVNGIALAGIKE